MNGLTGYVAPSSMLAIMGPSGSGKTTLLNVLAGRINKRRWEGDVFINGISADRSILKVVAGYVPQDDILYGSQTVYEALMFYAHLKLPHLSDQEKDKRVCFLIDELGLRKVKDSLIGFYGSDAAASGLQRGISGGERKRTSIGCQLIADPSLLFLDEPTTGLDSYAAEAVIRVLRRQSQLGRTIIFTIHQPSTEILNLFDQLMIIANGRTVYFGPQRKALRYFASVGYPCPPDENPGDHFVEVIHRETTNANVELDQFGEDSSSDFENEKESEQENPPPPKYVPRIPTRTDLPRKKLKEKTDEDDEKKEKTDEDNEKKEESTDEEEMKKMKEKKEKNNGKEIEQPMGGMENFSIEDRVVELERRFQASKYSKKKPPPFPETAQLPPLRRASLWVQFRELFKRNSQRVIRDPAAAKAGLAQNVLISLVMGLIYLQLPKNQAGIQDRAGAIFFGVVFLMFGGLMPPLSLFSVERKQFLFQYMEALYTPVIYYIAKVVPEIIPVIINDTIFVIIMYFMLGLWMAPDKFFINWVVSNLLVLTTQAFAFFLAGMIKSQQALISVFPLFFLPQMVFSGFYLNSASTPVYFIWVEYLSIVKYTFRPLIKNELEGASFYCTPQELQANKGVCPYTLGDQWLIFRDLYDFPIYGDVLILILFFLFYHAMGMFFTRRTAIQSTK
uniref:ABC transporter domain-containing protein n=1 Tax=Arcella intermedia TaxID=1963864 RepID=A0A6B2KZC7_9EUKA